MVMAEAEQPTTAQAAADAPATEPTTLAAAADAGKATDGQQATTEQAPEWKARMEALEKAVADKDARLRGQDKAINKVVRRLDDLKAGTPEAKALRLQVEAMREDAKNQVDPSDPASATSKAVEQGKALMDEAARSEAAATVEEEEAEFMQRITPRLERLGLKPNEKGVFIVDDDTRPIAKAVRSGNLDLAEAHLKILELGKNMTTQATKPAPKTYTQEEFDKAVAEQAAKMSQKVNKSTLRESGLLETSAAVGTGGGSRLAQLESRDPNDLTHAEIRELARLKSPS